MDMADDNPTPRRGSSSSSSESKTQAAAEQDMVGTPHGTQAQAEQEVAPPGQGGELATREGEQAPPVIEDPYKMVYSPWELPANTAAAAAISQVVEVDPELKLSPERQAQAEAAIQQHQDNVAEVVAGAGTDDPRLGGATFADYNAQQAQATAERQQALAERQSGRERVSEGNVDRGYEGRPESRAEERAAAREEKAETREEKGKARV